MVPRSNRAARRGAGARQGNVTPALKAKFAAMVRAHLARKAKRGPTRRGPTSNVPSPGKSSSGLGGDASKVLVQVYNQVPQAYTTRATSTPASFASDGGTVTVPQGATGVVLYIVISPRMFPWSTQDSLRYDVVARDVPTEFTFLANQSTSLPGQVGMYVDCNWGGAAKPAQPVTPEALNAVAEAATRVQGYRQTSMWQKLVVHDRLLDAGDHMFVRNDAEVNAVPTPPDCYRPDGQTHVLVVVVSGIPTSETASGPKIVGRIWARGAHRLTGFH